MEFTTEDIGGVAVARLKGVLDSAGVAKLHENVESLLAGRERKVVLDFSEIDALDPMGLAELLKLSRWTKEAGLRLRVAHAAPHVEEAFRDNMISDVDFHPDVDSALRFEAAAAAPPPREPEPRPDPQPKPPPRPGFLRRYWWLLAGAAVLVALVGVAGWFLFQPDDREVVFLTADGQEWTRPVEQSLVPGEERELRFRVRNADQVMPIRNERWVEMRVEPGATEDTKEVIYRLAPDKDFPATDTFFYVTAADDKPRLQSPRIYLESAVKAVQPKFDTSARKYENHGDGKEGFLLAPGTEGEQYGPDGITATGGSGLRYTASGHEPYGLLFDEITGMFSGEAQKPTPDGDYVPIKITARNAAGEQAINALLLIAKEPERPPTPAAVANVFAEEIDKRFKLVDIRSLGRENIELLFRYKDAIQKQGEGDVHKVGTVFFTMGKAILPVEYQRRLELEFEKDRFRELAADEATYFFVLGFADKGRTPEAINKRLIKERAETLRDFLAGHLGTRYGLSPGQIDERVRVIPMMPVPDAEGGGTVLFESRERSRAGEIWLVRDPRRE
jgi:anti-anti-sigma factor